MIVAGIYNDAGISARKRYTKRPALLQLIDDCEKGKIDIILFTKLDRWFRSVADYYEVQTKLDASHVPWRAIWEDYETETSAGVFKVNIMLSVAQSEADRTSERIKSVFDYKRQKGQYIGRVPYGYKLKDGIIVEDEEKSQNVRDVFSLYIQACSSVYVLKKMREKGVQLSISGVKFILNNPVYCGEGTGVGFAYITKEEYDQIQRAMHKHCRTTGGGHDYIFSGILKCEYCGHSLQSTMSAIRTRKKIRNYGYACYGYSMNEHDQCVTVSEAHLERLLVSCFDDVLSKVNYERKQLKSKEQDYSKQINSLKEKQKRLMSLFEEGDIEIDEYRKRRDDISKTINELMQKAKPHEDIVLPDNWKDMYYCLSNMERRAFWRSFIKDITIRSGKKTDVSDDITLL